MVRSAFSRRFSGESEMLRRMSVKSIPKSRAFASDVPGAGLRIRWRASSVIGTPSIMPEYRTYAPSTAHVASLAVQKAWTCIPSHPFLLYAGGRSDMMTAARGSASQGQIHRSIRLNLATQELRRGDECVGIDAYGFSAQHGRMRNVPYTERGRIGIVERPPRNAPPTLLLEYLKRPRLSPLPVLRNDRRRNQIPLQQCASIIEVTERDFVSHLDLGDVIRPAVGSKQCGIVPRRWLRCENFGQA